mgnify:CR=1 FL=1
MIYGEIDGVWGVGNVWHRHCTQLSLPFSLPFSLPSSSLLHFIHSLIYDSVTCIINWNLTKSMNHGIELWVGISNFFTTSINAHIWVLESKLHEIKTLGCYLLNYNWYLSLSILCLPSSAFLSRFFLYCVSCFLFLSLSLTTFVRKWKLEVY